MCISSTFLPRWDEDEGEGKVRAGELRRRAIFRVSIGVRVNVSVRVRARVRGRG